jgi:hypothetical protein
MNIHHRPIFNQKTVTEHYTERDGVPVKYVCTSASNAGTVAMDIYYRDTPHPKFGNRYFGLFYSPTTDDIRITNADAIENLDFDMIEVNGGLHYSQDRHDYHTVGDVAIDGGRAYTRLAGNIHNHPMKKLRVKDGEFVEINEDE